MFDSHQHECATSSEFAGASYRVVREEWMQSSSSPPFVHRRLRHLGQRYSCGRARKKSAAHEPDFWSHEKKWRQGMSQTTALWDQRHTTALEHVWGECRV